MNLKFAICIFQFSLLTLISCSMQKADLILINGKIFTVNKNFPYVKSIAIAGEKIIAVGSNELVEKFRGPNTRVIDLQGKTVVPGFNDAHLHFLGGGLLLSRVNLEGVNSIEEFQKRVKTQIEKLPKGAWILGRGWDHTLFPDKKLPTKEILDKVSPDNPVFLNRIDGHIALANSLALKIAGITKDSQNPKDGEIVKDPKTGEPTGILKEDPAMELVSNKIPNSTFEEMSIALQNALDEAKKFGVTSIQDGHAARAEDFSVYEDFLKKGKLTVRVAWWGELESGSMKDEGRNMNDEVRKKYPITNPNFHIGILKAYSDGSLGSRTASMLEPYNDDPSTSGLPQMTQEEMDSLVIDRDKKGFQIGIHAIGDRANRMVLNSFEKVMRINGFRDRRYRIEHAQVIHQEDIQRFAKLGVIASMQPTHCISDKRWVEDRIGKGRAKGAYVWKSLLKSEAKICFGTDWPVEHLNPMEGLYAAVTRQSVDGEPKGGWFPEERLTMEEAVECYTLGSAYAEFQENVKGSIELNKLADLVVLSQDIFTIPPEKTLETKVVYTVFGGKIIYEMK
jgi:predicted amidohydrolase YtcJ